MLTRGGAALTVAGMAAALLGPRLGVAVVGDRETPPAAVPAPPDAGTWRPFRRQDGRPVGFDACRVVTYVVHVRGPDTAGDDEDAARAAVADAARASGLRFRYDGRTDAVPRVGDHPGSADPLWVGWADDSQTDLFASHAEAVGMGGSDVVVDGRREVRVGGYAAVRSTPAGAASVRDRAVEAEVLRHELGHALGLDHVEDARELLFHDVAVAVHAGYGPGDRRGLWELGAGQGCG